MSDTKLFPSDGTARMLDRVRPERLTQQQQLFVREYLIDLNATQAWIRAGGNPVNADKVGAKMMKKGTLVQIAVARAMAERSARVGITGDRVLRQFARIAFGDPRVLFRDDGSLRPPTEYSEDDASMIEGVKTRRIVELDGDGKMQQAEIQEVKIASQVGALTALGRHLGLFNDKLDVTVNGSLAARLQEAYKRTGTKPGGTGQLTAPDGATVDVEYEEVDADYGYPTEDDDLVEMLK